MFHSFALLCKVFTDTPNIAEMSLQVKWREFRNSSLSPSTAAFGLPNDSAIFFETSSGGSLKPDQILEVLADHWCAVQMLLFGNLVISCTMRECCQMATW